MTKPSDKGPSKAAREAGDVIWALIELVNGTTQREIPANEIAEMIDVALAEERTAVDRLIEHQHHPFRCFSQEREALDCACGLDAAIAAVLVAGCLSWAAIIVREVLQWPPNEARPYDPFVDGAFFLAGGLAGGLSPLFA